MLKKLALLFSFIALAMVFSISKRKTPNTNENKLAKGWKKYSKKSNIVKTSIVKIEEVKEEKKSKKRSPAAVQKRKFPMRNGRYLDGSDAKSFTNITKPLKFKNKVDPKWQEKLGHSLSKIHTEGTEVLIKKERPVLYVKNGLGEFREQVIINFKLVDGTKTSYRAMVDSSNGRIIYTYDRTKIEHFRSRPTGMTHPLAN